MFFVIKKKTIIYFFATLIAIILLIFLLFGGGYADVYFGYANKEVPIYRVETDKKEIALTFDTAYGNDKTLQILDILQEFDADATFFLVGYWVENFEPIAKEIANRKFEIGSHSNTHPHFNRLTQSQMKDELAKSIAIIEKSCEVTPTLFRAPFGEYNDKLLAEAKLQGLTTIQWNIDSLDWRNLTATEIAQRLLLRVTNGSIILMHNNSDQIETFLPIVLASLKEQGYSFKRVSELLYKENSFVDSSGTQKLVS